MDFVWRLIEKLQYKYFYLPFCVGCFLIALILGLICTESGSNVSPDSARYIVVGNNIYNGEGFKGIGGYVFNHYPLYPLLIAGIMHFGLEAEQAARLIPILSFALLMFPLFFLSRRVGTTVAGYIVCIICLVSYPMLFLASTAWPDMPFVLMAVSTILFWVIFAASDKGSTKLVIMCGLLTAAATLMRITGLVLIITGLIVICVSSKFLIRKAFPQILIFCLTACLPVIPWLWRNYIVSSQLTAGFTLRDSYQPMAMIDSINWIITNIVDVSSPPFSHMGILLKLSPDFHSYATIIFIAFCIMFLVWYLVAHPKQNNKMLEYLKRIYIPALFTFTYLIILVMTMTIFVADHESRFLSVIYPFLIIIMVSFPLNIYYLVKGALSKLLIISATAIFCISLFIGQMNNSVDFYQHYAKSGMGYNSPFWRDNKAIAWVADNISSNAVIYSDRAEAIEFRIKIQTKYLPHSGNQGEIEALVKDLESGGNVYVVCFKKGRREYMLSNAEIIEINKKRQILSLVADFPEASIWHK